MDIDDNVFGEIVHRILSVAQPKCIIVFGSAATGQTDQDSDIDLLVLDDAPTDILRYRATLRSSLLGMGYPFDVFVMSPERFEESKNVIGGLAFSANKYGKVVYEARKYLL